MLDINQVMDHAKVMVRMNGSKLGLAVGAVMLLALAAGPLGCESSSSSSGGVAPDGGGVFEPDGGGNPDANVEPPVASECVPPTKGPTMHGGGSTSDPDDDVWTADGIGAGSYTGNGIDQILLPSTSGNETITETTTLHDRGVPYLVGHATSSGDLRVDVPAGRPSVTLTIEPGVTMKFKKSGVLRIAVAQASIADGAPTHRSSSL